MIRTVWAIWTIFFNIFFVISSKLFIFVSFIAYLLHLTSSASLTKSLAVPYGYISIKSIDCIFLSSRKIKLMSLISSVKRICLSLYIFAVFLILIYCFINLKVYNCLEIIYVTFIFFLDSLFYFHVEFLLNTFYNPQI